MEAKPRVAVVLVTWNAGADLARCLQHLRANTDWPYTLVVVDNGSTDGTREAVSRLTHHGDAPVRVLLPETNTGWVGGVNLAIRACPAELYFLLNPDAFVQPGWLSPLVQTLQADPSLGFASPKFRYLDGSVHYAGAYVSPGYSVRVHGHAEADDGRFDSPARVPFAHGMSLVRRSVIDAVGALDPEFGLGYFEEVDLQLRARRKGFGVAYVPASVIVHATSAAFDQHPGGLKETLLTRNWLRVMALHWPWRWALARLPLELVRPLRAALGGHSPLPSLRALVQFARSLPEVRQARHRAARSGNLAHRELEGPPRAR